MPYKSLSLIRAMNRYIPFDADSGSLYEEHVSLEDAPPSYHTKTLEFVLAALSDDATSLIVLTGDAGHGKTHLCRRVIELGDEYEPGEALRRMESDREGRTPIHLPGVGREVRIIKDLSEFPEDHGAELLISILEDAERVGLVCANEGLLRSITNSHEGDLGNILETLEDGVRSGVTGLGSGVCVVNLNFQSAAPEESGFVRHLLEGWVGDGRRWTACKDCTAQPACPVYRNKELFAVGANDAEQAKTGILQLVRIAEQSGYVLTFREALVLVSYLITGGLTCEDVAELHVGEPTRLKQYELEKLAFEKTLTDAQAPQLRILSRVRRYDPGVVPLRRVDEEIIGLMEEEGVLGNSAWFAGTTSAQTRRRRRTEAEKLRDELRSRRRAAYLSDPALGEDGLSDRTSRLGLQHYRDFAHVQSDDEDPGMMRRIVEGFVQGLHVIQGIRVRDRSALYLVDPAFSRSGSSTSVIAVQLPKNHLWLYGLHEFWESGGGAARVDMTSSVDWVNRQVVLCLAKDEEHESEELLRLDLFQFEFVMRASEGSSFPSFHSADRRRILNRLARVVELHSKAEDVIKFVSGQSLKRLVVEQDGSITVYEGH